VLKLDVEGAESELFASLAGLRAVDFIVAEVHFTDSEHSDFEAVRRALAGFDVEILRADRYGGLMRARRRTSVPDGSVLARPE
jgi:hypothetical protein